MLLSVNHIDISLGVKLEKPEDWWEYQEITLGGELYAPGEFDPYPVRFPPDIIELYNFIWTGPYTIVCIEFWLGEYKLFSEAFGAGGNGGNVPYRVYQSYQWGGAMDSIHIFYYDYYPHSSPPPTVVYSGLCCLYGGSGGGEDSITSNL